MKRGDGANQVAIAMKLLLPAAMVSAILWFGGFLCSVCVCNVLVGERDASLIGVLMETCIYIEEISKCLRLQEKYQGGTCGTTVVLSTFTSFRRLCFLLFFNLMNMLKILLKKKNILKRIIVIRKSIAFASLW
jgi:hypothetical protein